MSDEDPMFSSRTALELTRVYDRLLREADFLGIEWTRRREFPNHQELIRECQALSACITRFREGVDVVDERGSPGLRRLRSSPQAEVIRQQTLADNARARQEAESRIRRTAEMNDTATTTNTNGSAPPPAVKDVSKKTSKAEAKVKRAVAPEKKIKKKVKKAASKKAASKKASAKKEKKAGAGGRLRFDPDHVITWIADKNTRRPGSAAYERLERVRKSSTKKVSAFTSAGGREATLIFAVKKKLAKVGPR